jgi:WD40 repeat protein
MLAFDAKRRTSGCLLRCPLFEGPLVRSAFLTLMLTAIVGAQDVGPPPREYRVDRNGYPLPAGVIARLGIPPPLNDFTRTLAWTADGKHFVAADSDGTTLFDAATGKCVRHFPVPTDSTRPTALLIGDGDLLVRLSGPKGTLTDTTTGEPILSFTLPSPLGDAGRKLYSFSVTADCRFLAGIASEAGQPRVAWRYDLANCRFTRPIPNRADLQGVRLSPDGKRVYATGGGTDPDLTAREAATGKGLWTVSLKWPGSIRAISRDGRRLAVAHANGIDVFDTANGGRIMAVPADSASSPGGWGIDLSADGNRIALADGDKVRVLSVPSGKIEHRLAHPAQLAVFAPDGKSLLTATAWVQKWDLATGKPTFTEPILEGPYGATQLTWSADGRRLLAVWIGERLINGGPQHRDLLTIWNPLTTDCLWKLQSDDRVVLASLDRDGATVRAFTEQNELRFWNTDYPDKLGVARVARSSRANEAFNSFRPDGLFAVSWLEETGVRLDLYDGMGRCELRRVRAWPAGMNDRLTSRNHLAHKTVAYGPGGWRFELAAGHELPVLASPPSARIMSLVASDSDAFVAGRYISNSSINEHLWESLTGGVIADLPRDIPNLQLARLSSDGRLLAMSTKEYVLIRDFRDPQAVHRIPSPGASALAFSPEATLLATAQTDGTILIWDLSRHIGGRNALAADRIWRDLESGDARVGWLALWDLLDHPREAINLLQTRLLPESGWTDTDEQIARLDHARYAVREQATKELTGRGNMVEGDLQRAINSPRSEEQRTRVEQLLQKLNHAIPPSGPSLRALRCIWLLERKGTSEARKLLETLTSGAPGSRVTAEARAALERSVTVHK